MTIVSVIAPRQFSIENFGGLSDSPRPCVRPCVRNGMRCSEPMGQIILIFCMKLTYNGTTKTHISNFQKIKHGRRYGDNYR